MNDDEFWTARTELKLIREAAHARLAAPLSVLGAVLRHGIAAVEPHVVLPPTVGTRASVNLFTAITARSGAGKDGATGVAADVIRFHDDDGVELTCLKPTPGSGAGLARIFRGHKDEDPITRAHICFHEVTALEAVAGRQGNDLEATLLAAYMGQTIGSYNNNRDTTTALAPHSYRLALSVGVQPATAGYLLDRSGSGLLQRFLWLPAVDPAIPFTAANAPIEPTIVQLPPVLTLRAEPGDYRDINLPPEAIATTRRMVHLNVTGAAIDPTESHANLTRLKVAFALAVLDGRADVDDDDWTLSGYLADTSRETLRDVQDAVKSSSRRRRRQTALDRAEDDSVAEERKAELEYAGVERRLWQHMGDGGRYSERDLMRAISSTKTHYAPRFVAEKLQIKAIAVAHEEGDRTTYYRRTHV